MQQMEAKNKTLLEQNRRYALIAVEVESAKRKYEHIKLKYEELLYEKQDEVECREALEEELTKYMEKNRSLKTQIKQLQEQARSEDSRSKEDENKELTMKVTTLYILSAISH